MATPAAAPSRLWTLGLGFAGINDCAMAGYHFFLPHHWGWAKALDGVPTSITWALFALNFSWSLLVFLTGALVVHAASRGPRRGAFARRFVFVVGLFWLIHGIYTWIHPLPMPKSLVALQILLAAFPVVMVLLHWAPLFGTARRADDRLG